MRKDVANKIAMMEGMELMNKSELSRRFGCNRRTIDKYIENPDAVREKREYVSILEDYKNIVIDKVDTYGSTAMAVFKFIQKKGYAGSYLTVNNFVREHKAEEVKKATIRFETIPGQQAQVDWKETITMINRHGEKFVINIFLLVLGYSRLKFTKLTTNRTQKTLFECLFNAFVYIHASPHEILFDNMATVVDRDNSTFKNVALNKTFKMFAQDAGFEVITCRPYRAKTKGKVETLAKLVDRLKVYNEEFETFEELEKIVEEFNDDINNEVSQATNEIPFERFKKEQEHLKSLPPMECLLSYFFHEKKYKVYPDSMVRYKGRKYSVPINFIGKELSINEADDEIQIYYTQDLICCHKISEKFFNYKKDHAFEILKSDAMMYNDEEAVYSFIENNLRNMDILLE